MFCVFFFVSLVVALIFWALAWGLAGILVLFSFMMIVAPLGLHVPIVFSFLVLATLLGGSIFVSLKWQKTIRRHRLHVED